MLLSFLALLALSPVADPFPHNGKYFKIAVVDDQTGRGVPLVELTTVNNILHVTDSNGIVAFYEPGLMGRKVFFHLKSHGYEFPTDGFGFRGRSLDIKEGGNVQLKIKRVNIAERLYRVTGGGIYRDSVLVRQRVPIRQPLLNAQVLGSDSVVNAIYRGKLYWFWGDTNKPAYPLGNFHVPGAVWELPAGGGLDPATGVDLEYFQDAQGFAKQTAPMPGQGPTWINGLVTVTGKGRKERLFASYVKVRGQLDIHARGLAEFNDDKKQFEKVADIEMKAVVHPNGHAFKREEGGIEFVYFGNPYPFVRVRATPENLRNLASYQAFTCLKEGSRLDRPKLDRDADGNLRYAWKTNTPPLGPNQQARLIKDGKLKPAEALLQLQDADTGQAVLASSGSVYWNEFRKRWVMIVAQAFGTSMLGETWYAEADTPLGPWVYACKIVTHVKYSFYNPKHHPYFDKDNGRVIFFEGTYTHTFSGNTNQTPRYDYNQIMYRLDLADPRLVLPVPVYLAPDRKMPNQFAVGGKLKPDEKSRRIAFFALDRPRPGAVPVYAWQSAQERGALQVGTPPVKTGKLKPVPVFYALPADTKKLPATTLPLYEYVHKDGKTRAYTTDKSWHLQEYRRVVKPICIVWRNPLTKVSDLCFHEGK